MVEIKKVRFLEQGTIKYSSIGKELTALGVRTGLHAGRLCCVN